MKLLPLALLVVLPGCSSVDPGAGRNIGPESVRDACVRFIDTLAECPGSVTNALGVELPSVAECQVLSDAGHCEAFSESVGCLERFDICSVLAEPYEAAMGEVAQCITDVLESEFDSGQCSPFRFDGLLSSAGTVDFFLTGGVGTFNVAAGVLVEKSGTLTFDPGASAIASQGSLSVDIDDVSVRLADTSDNGFLTITVHVSTFGNADGVCDSETPQDKYGPFFLEFDGNNNVLSVSPTSVPLGDLTVNVLNVGEFAVCLKVLSPANGVVTIDHLAFNVGL